MRIHRLDHAMQDYISWHRHLQHILWDYRYVLSIIIIIVSLRPC